MSTWPKPAPLGTARRPDPFPTDALPAWLAEFVEATATAYQVPADLPGMLTLSALAGVCGGRVRVKARPGFEVPTNLYVAVALPPASRKSPVFSTVAAPLRAVEAELRDASIPQVDACRARREMAEKRAAEAKAKAAKASAEDREELEAAAVAAEQALSELADVRPFRLLADDATPEQLATILYEQGGRLAVLADEGAIFGQMQGRYSSNGAPNLSVYLKGHDGGQLLIDRRGRSERLDSPALTVGVAVQPMVLQQIGENAELAGRGLVARFLFAMPEDTVGRRELRPAPVPSEVAAAYERELSVLARSLLSREDVVSGGDPETVTLSLSDEADLELLEFEAEIEEALASGGLLDPIREWGGKLVGHTIRIAGLLHIASTVRSGLTAPISGETMLAAIRIARYAIPHMQAVADLLGTDETLVVARKVLDTIGRKGMAEFSKRDVFNAVRCQQVQRSSQLDEPLRLLCDRGWLRVVEPRDEFGNPLPPSPGRPKSPRFEPHPSLLEQPALAA